MIWAAMRVGRYAARSGRRSTGPKVWSAGTRGVWFVILGGMCIAGFVKDPAAGIAVVGALVFLVVAAYLAGSAHRESMADIARARHQARRDALDVVMGQYEEKR